jgi:hypothetical protein
LMLCNDGDSTEYVTKCSRPRSMPAEYMMPMPHHEKDNDISRSCNMPFKILALANVLCFLVQTCHAAPTLIADLDYGTFAGAYNSKYNISYWQKVPFAAPPVGQNRFRAPQPPLRITNGTYNSTQTFDYCPQRTSNGTEDCLYLVSVVVRVHLG